MQAGERSTASPRSASCAASAAARFKNPDILLTGERSFKPNRGNIQCLVKSGLLSTLDYTLTCGGSRIGQLKLNGNLTADVKVIGSDKLRFAVYEGEDTYKVYIFNSDFNNKQFVKVVFKGEEKEIAVDSVALEILELKK